jgi:hypothetical protein
MRHASLPVIVVLLIGASSPLRALAHDPRLDLPEPQSVPEAWNVIRESAENVSKLLELGQLPDVAYQIANTSAPLRLLEAHAKETSDPTKLPEQTKRLLNCGFDVINATREKMGPLARAREKWAEYRKILAELEAMYPQDTLNAVVYVCPMHPKDRHLKAGDKCGECGMALIRRRIPASTVYEKPGEPSMKLAVSSGQLVVGKESEVRIRLSKSVDGSPVVLDDLVEMHTKKIHLMINDTSLSDYHHEHPTPTGRPGEYVFKMTPNNPGPYRIWADVVLGASSIQEYVIGDIPADTKAAPLSDRETVYTAIVNGRKYDVVFYTNGRSIRAGEVVAGTITVTGSDGKPFTKLEPIMGTYAHIVGFCEDGKTVIHVHPYGQEPTKAEDRGGPAFGFKLYVPTPGFIRLYGQVQIDGQSQFAPFGLTVVPPVPPPAEPPPSDRR